MVEEKDIFDNIGDAFKNEGAEKYQVLNSLIDPENPETKTDLTVRQIKGIILTEFLCEIAKTECGMDIGYIKTHITKAIKIHNYSKNRMSRSEIIDEIGRAFV